MVAYEPVWAIGTGKVATPDDAQEVCAALRAAARASTAAVAEQVRILYGGSVKSKNVAELMAQPDVDGASSAGRAWTPTGSPRSAGRPALDWTVLPIGGEALGVGWPLRKNGTSVGRRRAGREGPGRVRGGGPPGEG